MDRDLTRRYGLLRQLSLDKPVRGLPFFPKKLVRLPPSHDNLLYPLYSGAYVRFNDAKELLP